MNDYPRVGEQPEQHAEELIQAQEYLTIASASQEGTPWVSPVFYAVDAQFSFYWVSEKTSRHSRLIKENPRIAFVIYDDDVEAGDGGAVYVEAEAAELGQEDDLDHAVHVYNQEPQDDELQIGSVDEVTGEASWRIYRAVPQQAYVLGEPEYVDGQYVSRRVKISL